ncbi:MAG: hypothetical protein ABI668_02930 [Sphingorhabdus sp.]
MLDPKLRGIIYATAAAALVAGCGADDIASPGTGGNITINNPPAAAPPPPPPPPVSTLVTPATGCPTITDPQGLTDSGTITGTTGEYRVCTLPARINVSTSLPKITGLLYRLGGRVDVGTDQGPASTNNVVTLTIAPGVIVFGGTGVSWLNVNRGNRISAVGTAALPIVFTSRDNVLGLNTDASIGQWGGVVLNGRAPITDCAAPAATPGTIACERQVEGAIDPALYGGATAADNSGRMSYVQIRYSGFVLSGNSELQSLTTGGIGSGTVLDHIQSFNSSDDGAEFFGGNVNMKYFVSIGADDDNLDTDTGVKANFQYVLAVQRQGAGDSMIEADSDNALDGNTPRQNTRLSNFTFIQRNNTGNLTAILLRGGTDYTLANGVIVSPNTSCLRISRAQTASATVDASIDEAGAPVVRSVVAQCGTPAFVGLNGVTDAEVSAIFGSGTNNNNSAFTPTLSSLFINGASETAVTAFNANTLAAFFDTTTYIGAVKDANDTWYAGWTCNSATAALGTSVTGLCTSLPTF